MNRTNKSHLLQAIGSFGISLGLLVILGWVLNIQFLKTIFDGYVSMKINTAIGFIFAGILPLLYIKNKSPKLGTLLAITLSFLAMASLFQDLFSFDFGIDQLLLQDLDAVQRTEKNPGRPSPATSICFLLFGLAFSVIQSNNFRLKKAAQYTLHLISLISFVAILGYLFHVSILYKLSIFTSMAIHTAFTLFILSLGSTFINPKLGVISIFTGRKIGNIMARNLFIKMLISILVLSLIHLILVRLQWVSKDFGIAMFTTAFIFATLYTLTFKAKLLNGLDDKRNEAEEKLHERTKYLIKQNKQLEDFAHIVSHNLRGPISNLKSLLIFYNQEDSKEEKATLIQNFEKTVINLDDTLNELLEVVSIRHESKKEKKQLAFKSVFDKLTETYHGKIIEMNAKVTCNFQSAPTLNYSSTYLKSIMQNLLSNSLKYRSLERDPIIHFETIAKNENIYLTVTDNGLGIDLKANGHHLFGFHKTFNRHPEAKGVGLFITKAQVEAMGGEISAESEVGKGTTFKIKF